jgi:hypothetical protein
VSGWRHQVAVRSPLLAAALVAVACTEATGPDRRGPGAPSFSFSPNGITLNESNGSLRENGRILIKGFDPRNPRLGDAVVATFYWVGSSNIIDSVVDVLADANFTRVGNQYHLVEYVTANGMSMATYVATNVRNFRDSDSTPGRILAVRAHLAQPVSDGGVTISAWTGVEDNLALAVGAHGSASGFDQGVSAARADPVPVGAGALAYTVTMSGLFGLQGPQADGYTTLGVGSDDVFKEDAAYTVFPSGGTTDPQWTWFYGGDGGTWLATTLVLNPGVAPSSENLTVTATTTGSNPDPDGYTVTLDGTDHHAIAATGSVSFTNVTAGNHTVTLFDVVGNCTVSGDASRTVTIASGETATVSYAVSCVPVAAIELDRENGALNVSGRVIAKGFTTVNPHNGDAIIATFFWLGSTNIIDSVTDHLNDASSTPVGNQYHLVEYVTGDGISMATYVATNVQGFLDAGTTQGQMLDVQAHLSDSVADGGGKVSAWRGAQPVFAQAVGAHRSASGADSEPTVANPGAVSVGAGELVYAVTMSNALVGLDRPLDFTSLGGGGSDSWIKEDAVYAVRADAGTASAEWTWFFDQSPGTWVASVLTLMPAPGP